MSDLEYNITEIHLDTHIVEARFVIASRFQAIDLVHEGRATCDICGTLYTHRGYCIQHVCPTCAEKYYEICPDCRHLQGSTQPYPDCNGCSRRKGLRHIESDDHDY